MMAARYSYKLQKNGEDVTAQQVHDAFMSGVVLLNVSSIGSTQISAINTTCIFWCDSAGVQNDPSDVAYVKLYADDLVVEVGDAYVLPAN